MLSVDLLIFFFFFNDTATTEIYTLSLHDALPISSASGPLVIHILLPFRTNFPLRYSARVFIETTSEPEPGSDMASAPTQLPATSLGRYLRFWASVPFRRIWLTQRLECAP